MGEDRAARFREVEDGEDVIPDIMQFAREEAIRYADDHPDKVARFNRRFFSRRLTQRNQRSNSYKNQYGDQVVDRGRHEEHAALAPGEQRAHVGVDARAHQAELQTLPFALPKALRHNMPESASHRL